MANSYSLIITQIQNTPALLALRTFCMNALNTQSGSTSAREVWIRSGRAGEGARAYIGGPSSWGNHSNSASPDYASSSTASDMSGRPWAARTGVAGCSPSATGTTAEPEQPSSSPVSSTDSPVTAGFCEHYTTLSVTQINILKCLIHHNKSILSSYLSRPSIKHPFRFLKVNSSSVTS